MIALEEVVVYHPSLPAHVSLFPSGFVSTHDGASVPLPTIRSMSDSFLWLVTRKRNSRITASPAQRFSLHNCRAAPDLNIGRPAACGCYGKSAVVWYTGCSATPEAHGSQTE